MKIVIAPQAFKGSLSATQAADAIASGTRQVFPNAELVLVPVADGGDGTLDALINATTGTIHTGTVSGPLGQPVSARWGVLGDGATAVVEAAQACGLALLSERDWNPLKTSSYGVGELIRHALDAGYRRIIIGLGGSSTNDGASGLLGALGGKLLDVDGVNLRPGGAALLDLSQIDLPGMDPRL